MSNKKLESVLVKKKSKSTTVSIFTNYKRNFTDRFLKNLLWLKSERCFYRLMMWRQIQKIFKAPTPWKHNGQLQMGKTWHNNTKKWTSHILCICVCLHVLTPSDPEFLFIQENNCITIKTTHSDPQLLRYNFVIGKTRFLNVSPTVW